MSRPQGYSRLQIVLHWTIALLIFVQLSINEPMQRAFFERLSGKPLNEIDGAQLHVIVGLTVLVLGIVRVTIRTLRGTPPPHKETPAILNWLAHATHMLLYGFIFGMPITGALAWFLGIPLAAVLHEIGRLILIPAIALHVIGALTEQFVFRNDSLQRMFKARAR
ncbi:cytochrome b [Devosia submarina]|uniref:cytochrome b n=1 Tax=Devosia submarina TaxID=1173082 RepID=UPI00130059CE|nr:cytochrome b/b6 domain-containing protein [Devosia submarina]